jgi:hypothetical protein
MRPAWNPVKGNLIIVLRGGDTVRGTSGGAQGFRVRLKNGLQSTKGKIDLCACRRKAVPRRLKLGIPGYAALGDSGVVISSDAVLVGGRRFWDCASVVELSERCQKSVDFGPSELLDDSMNQLWRSILPGGIDRTVQFPFAPSRQWAEIIRSLEAMRSQRNDGCLTSFAYMTRFGMIYIPSRDENSSIDCSLICRRSLKRSLRLRSGTFRKTQERL